MHKTASSTSCRRNARWRGTTWSETRQCAVCVVLIDRNSMSKNSSPLRTMKLPFWRKLYYIARTGITRVRGPHAWTSGELGCIPCPYLAASVLQLLQDSLHNTLCTHTICILCFLLHIQRVEYSIAGAAVQMKKTNVVSTGHNMCVDRKLASLASIAKRVACDSRSRSNLGSDVRML